MKNVFIALLGFSASAFAITPMQGTLTVDSVTDNVTSYKCQLEGGTGYTIQLAHDTSARTMTVQLGGKLAYPENTTLKITGPYYEVDSVEPGKAAEKSFEMEARAYDLKLAFTDGKALPLLTLAWGARPFLCQP